MLGNYRLPEQTATAVQTISTLMLLSSELFTTNLIGLLLSNLIKSISKYRLEFLPEMESVFQATAVIVEAFEIAFLFHVPRICK
jgi:hypothetical protein